ncbi:MFS transporter [Nitratireductor basaltis]|uniref:Major facilitator superfamily MFS_1 n=1 Tax=Nitratireductor basaltis TaxID=472175 RepID=A0A084U8M7_9HYPH|nr:MFS transporter [Nitratireductor basaltis]KFB09313.1 Major facilitator superfamily MFS_1 [Nitratireductor basaltis]
MTSTTGQTHAHSRQKPGLGLHALTLIAFLAASSVPAPLYPLYQAQWGFSAFTITLVFAVYALALLVGLLFFGTMSNRFGRRAVILLALSIQLSAMGIFLLARDSNWLIVARIVQGFATGLATTALAAALLDLDQKKGATINSIAPMIGMGVGALGSGLLAQMAPAPLHLGFVLLVLLFTVQTLRTVRSTETSPSLSAGPWKPRLRMDVPSHARRTFLIVSPINIAVWALGGFFLSLMPSLIVEIADDHVQTLGGAVVAGLTLAGALAIVALRGQEARTALLAGSLAMILGPAIILASLHMDSMVTLMTGTVVSGFGFGAGFLGAMRSLAALANPEQRAGLLAAFYTESYIANALPALIAGFMAQRAGLFETATIFGAAIIALAALSLALNLFKSRFVPVEQSA